MNTPAEIAQNYVGIGKKKTELPAVKMFVLGIMAGIFIGIGSIAYEMATATIGGGLGKLVGACMFPAGLALVLIAGSELFTGNCLLVIPLLEKEVKFSNVLKNWIFVYLGNFVGSAILAFLVVYGHNPSLLDGALLDTVMSVAKAKVSLSFGDAVLRGIVCNIMVCLAVWMSFAGKTVGGKMAGLYFPIMIFVLGGFEHSIANMYYLAAGMFANAVYGVGEASVNIGSSLLNNLLPVTIGNWIGGALIGVTYWFLYLKGTKKN
ncbi:MAG: formate/nitrite transporter family protein [Lachnospiraceae bacterium]|jgi:formate/nitrite transporter|nr:formate/nitrite transporter family protein [Lachnospiraceae bacterium]